MCIYYIVDIFLALYGILWIFIWIFFSYALALPSLQSYVHLNLRRGVEDKGVVVGGAW